MTAAAGPLGRVIESDGTVLKPQRGYQLAWDANALIILNRLAFPDSRPQARDGLDEKAGRSVLRWAAGSRLGQADGLVAQVAARRAQALRDMRAGGQAVVRLRAEPEWRLAAGLGNRANAHEIGLSLHGTYGWPVIPGSSLKGLAAAWAAADEADEQDVLRVLGSPRPSGRRPAADGAGGQQRTGTERPASARGSVRFLDAMPAGEPVTVAVDVLTPHVKHYYDSVTDGRGRPVPPAEYHNPVPVSFLTIRGAFAVDLYGPQAREVSLAAEWLTRAADELGAGAKTAAGYGYLTLTPVPDEEGLT